MFELVSKKKPDPDAVGPLANEIRRLRAKAGLRQVELAARAELSRQTISNLENGVYDDPEIPTLEKLAPVLGTTLEALVRLAKGAVDGSQAVSDSRSSLPVEQHRWPPGLEKWLSKRAGLSETELGGLKRYRSRPGDTTKDMESDAFWEQELEFVRESIRALTADVAGSPRGAQGGNASAPQRVPPGKSRH